MEMRKGKPYWRMIADLNPAITDPADVAAFERTLQGVDGMKPCLFSDAKDFGDKYFHIPALNRSRGASHCFLAVVDAAEMGGEEAAQAFGKRLAEAAIEAYTGLVQTQLRAHPEESVTEAERQMKLDYLTVSQYQHQHQPQ